MVFSIKPDWDTSETKLNIYVACGDNYECNLIICDSERKWKEFIPDATEEIRKLSCEYAAEVEK